MSRPIVLSNGEMHVGINPYGEVHDFYYPYVGLENHTAEKTLRHKIGVYVDGAMHWIDNGEWQITQDYAPQARLIGNTRAINNQIGIILEFHDMVDCEMTAFLRNIHIMNLRNEDDRDVRLYMHQIFVIADAEDNHDTGQYLPSDNAILHYKGRRAFVVGGEKSKYRGAFDSYSIGLNGIEGREGIWRDAEDGTLSENPVEHGRVDSIIEYKLRINAEDSERVFYWVACGKSTREALEIHERIRRDGLVHRILKTDLFWQKWIQKAENYANENIPEEFRKNFLQSVLILKSHIDKRGAVIASTDTTMLNYSRDAYGYCWPRDAVHVLWPLLRLGYTDEVLSFINFARRIMREEGYLMHKFFADGSLGSSWHPYIHDGELGPPIQTDETAIVLFLFAQLHETHHDQNVLREYFPTLVRPMANFLCGYVDSTTKLPRASYDLWEENYLTTTYTTALTYAALISAAELAGKHDAENDAVRWRACAEDMRDAAREHLWDDELGFFLKGLRKFPDGHIEYNKTIDSSAFYGAHMFGLFANDGPEVTLANKTLRKRFNVSYDGYRLPRYENDNYARAIPDSDGNPWFVTSLWLTQYDIENGNPSAAYPTLQNVNAFMDQHLILSEQVNPQTNEMISVAPLAWSHAEFVTSLMDYATAD